LYEEEYPDAEPFPAFLILGLCNNHPVHCVIAFDKSEKILAVITVYEPDCEYWEEDCKTRRRI